MLEQLGVRWLGWPHRRGVGCAVRAGLRYGSRLGFDVVVRLDADGQHDAARHRRAAGAAADRTGRRGAGIALRPTSDREPEPLKRALAAIVSP